MTFYKNFVRPGSLCFDVGANVGDRTAIFLALGATVVAVEPQPACVEVLKHRFGTTPRLHIEAVGLAENPGEKELLLSSTSTISSMSEAFVAATAAAGRFDDSSWNQGSIVVPTWTLDRLIADHGLPAFVKIDVEGSEEEVLRGASQPIDAVSFEFVPELFASMLACVSVLESLATYQFNYSLGESLKFELGSWVDASELVRRLEDYQDTLDWGDIYAAIQPPGSSI